MPCFQFCARIQKRRQRKSAASISSAAKFRMLFVGFSGLFFFGFPAESRRCSARAGLPWKKVAINANQLTVAMGSRKQQQCDGGRARVPLHPVAWWHQKEGGKEKKRCGSQNNLRRGLLRCLEHKQHLRGEAPRANGCLCFGHCGRGDKSTHGPE